MLNNKKGGIQSLRSDWEIIMEFLKDIKNYSLECVKKIKQNDFKIDIPKVEINVNVPNVPKISGIDMKNLKPDLSFMKGFDIELNLGFIDKLSKIDSPIGKEQINKLADMAKNL
jgi:hypothetical protein